MKGTNIAETEEDINTQNFTLEEDKYKDAPLSGTFECLHTNEPNLHEVLHTLGVMQNSSLNTEQQSSKNETILMDHAFSCVMQCDQSLSLPINSDCDTANATTEEDIVICGFTSLTINSEDIYEPIEVSMVIEDTSEQMTLAIPGTNTEQSNVSSSFPKNDELPCSPAFLGTNNHAALGSNQADFSISCTHTSTSNLDTNVSHIPGVNSTPTTMNSNTQSSSSSDFEGFHTDDIVHSIPPAMSKHSTTPSSSSSEFEGFHSDDIYEISSQYQLTTSEESSSPSIVMDSEDTVIYQAISNTTVKQNRLNPNSSQQFFLTKQINDQYSLEIVNLWKNDTMKKKWTVPIVNLSKDDIYLLSNPAPNWDNIDPYLGIEDIGSDSDKSEPVDNHPPNKSCNRSSMHTRNCTSALVKQGVQKSQCIKRSTITYTYDDASMSDSDYNPKPKVIKDPNIGLKGPSNSRLRAQAIIHAAKEESMAARQGKSAQSSLLFNKDRNQQCHYCGNSFYYSAGLKTHLDHAHKDILSVKGINDPQEAADAKGTNITNMRGVNNIAVTDPSSALGSNNATSPNPEPSTSSVNAVTPIVKHSSNTTQAPNNGSVISNQQMTETYHKRKAKPHGKHYRPIPVVPVVPKASVESSKPRFVTVTHGLKKSKKHHKFHCKLCQHVADSQASANKHYKENHPPVSCNNCNMLFSNPCSLRRHKYTHIEKKFSRRNCNKLFPFESDLASHRLKHRRHPGFQCSHNQNGNVCGKWYFAKSDLAKHARTHSGEIYSCYECDYMMIDVCYLRAHRYTHSDKLRYKCKNCSETFKHHTQMKQHEKNC